MTAGPSKDSRSPLVVAQGYPHVYMHFLANVVRAGLQRYVIPFPAPSRLAHDFLARLKGASQWLRG